MDWKPHPLCVLVCRLRKVGDKVLNYVAYIASSSVPLVGEGYVDGRTAS